jgi:hypothetical protein
MTKLGVLFQEKASPPQKSQSIFLFFHWPKTEREKKPWSFFSLLDKKWQS